MEWPILTTDNSKLIAERLTSRLIINQDAVNTTMLGIVSSKFEDFLNTVHDNNPKITIYNVNLKKNKTARLD